MRGGWVAWALAVALLVGSVAYAQPGAQPTAEQLDTARALAEEGLQRFEQGDHATALERFRSAEAIIHAPPHVLFIARSLEKGGQLLEARDTYRRLVGEALPADVPKAFVEAQSEGKAELATLLSRIPSLRIELAATVPESATLLLDGAPLARGAVTEPVEVNPGEHVVELRVEGQEPVSRTVDAKPGDRELVIELGGDPSGSGANDGEAGEALASDGSPSLAGPLVVLGVGVVGLGVGIVTGVLTLNDAAELKDRCPQNPCSVDNESLADSVSTLGTVSTISFIVGGAAAGAGLLWLALQGGGDGAEDGAQDAVPEGGAEQAVHLSPLVGFGFVGVRGDF